MGGGQLEVPVGIGIFTSVTGDGRNRIPVKKQGIKRALRTKGFLDRENQSIVGTSRTKNGDGFRI